MHRARQHTRVFFSDQLWTLDSLRLSQSLSEHGTMRTEPRDISVHDVVCEENPPLSLSL